MHELGAANRNGKRRPTRIRYRTATRFHDRFERDDATSYGASASSYRFFRTYFKHIHLRRNIISHEFRLCFVLVLLAELLNAID